jgi:hypothetical protein
MIRIVRSGHNYWTVIVPGREPRFFTTEYHAESYAEIASLTTDRDVVRMDMRK